MPADFNSRTWYQLTIRQLAVVVVFAAVASAVIRSLARESTGFVYFFFAAAVEVPFALVVPTLLLVRRGPLKSGLVASLCSIPLLAIQLYVLLNIIHEFRITSDPWDPAFLLFCARFMGIVELMLLPLLYFLSRWIVPRRCPRCGRLALLRDTSIPRPARDPRSCLACGAQFRREPVEPCSKMVAWKRVTGTEYRKVQQRS